MFESNIVAGSNVFMIRTDDPRQDSSFVAQVIDYELLKSIIYRRKVDSQIPNLSKFQMSIVGRGNRCTYAKNDPCIGPVDGKTQCKCINIDCPGIWDMHSFHGVSPWKGCNPDIDEDYIIQWSPNPDENELYGRPELLTKYYFVDMISDEEMARYKLDSGTDNIIHPPQKEEVIGEEDDKVIIENPRVIDPETGRELVIVGYEWKCIDNSYEDVALIPKWKLKPEDSIKLYGFVDETEEKEYQTVIRKAKKIEKKTAVESIKKIDSRIRTTDSDYANKEQYEKFVKSHIVGDIKLTKVKEEDIYGLNTVILLDNPAELAFVSSTLLARNIKHSIKTDSKVILALIDDYECFSSFEHVIVSNTVIKTGCNESNVNAWRLLSDKNEIEQLVIVNREYYQFEYDGKTRWTCKDMFGVTHVLISDKDINDVENLHDGLYKVSIVVKDILNQSGEPIGHLSDEFVRLIDELKNRNEIIAPPVSIGGISLKVVDEKLEVLGIGKLNIVEY